MGDPKQVKAVIKSIKEYSNFRQMAEYNISCLLTYITPPTVGWRENVAAAVEDGGIESIISVLAKHGNALDMVKQATTALGGLAISKDNAGRVAQNGGIETALNAMLKIKQTGPDQEQVINAGAKLIETVARYNPESILQQKNAVKAMLQGVQHQVPRVQTASATVLASIAMFEDGTKAIVSQGGIPALVNAIAPGKPTHEAMLKPLFRLLERLAKNPTYVSEMRNNKLVEALVSQLEAHSDNEYILRAGGRLLAKIADADIEDTIRRLNGNLSDGVRDHLVALLANLALQPENVEKIVKNGGIEVLLKNFGKYSPKTKAAALRALQRIANTGPTNADKIIAAGGLPIIIGAIQGANGDEDILKAGTMALTKIVASGLDQANLVHKAGGIQAVLDQMMKFPHLEGFTGSGLEMIEKLCGVGFPTDLLLQMGASDAIFAAMKNGLKNPEVQEKGFKALSGLMSSNDDKSNAMAAKRIGGHAELNVLCESLLFHKEEKAVVKAGVDAFAKLGMTESAQLKKVGALEALTEAVYSQMYREMLGKGGLSSDVKYTRNVKGLLNSLVETKRLTQLANALVDCSEAEKIELLKDVAVFSLNNDFAVNMQNAGVCKAISQSLSQQFVNAIPFHAVATWSLAKSGLEAMGELVESGCLKALLTSVKNNSKEEVAVTSVLRAAIPFAASRDYNKKTVTLGAIETSVTGMRSNPQSTDANLAAVELLIAVASNGESASQVCYKGGTKQVNKMIKESSTSPEFERPVQRALFLLYRVAQVDNADIKNQLTAQDTVTSVTTAMSAFPTNPEVLEVGAKILAILMSPEDVANAIEDVVALTKELTTTKKPDRVFVRLGQKAATVGFVSLNPANKTVFVEKQGLLVVEQAVDASKSKPLTMKREVAVMNEYRAVGQIASVLGPSVGLVDRLLKGLKTSDDKTSILEKVGILEGVKYLCNDARALQQLHDKGAIETITELLNSNRSDERFLQAALDALSALMNNDKGKKIATSAGTGNLIFGILVDDADNITSKAAASALDGLQKYAQFGQNSTTLVGDGVVDTVTNTLAIQCDNSEEAKPMVVSNAAALLRTLVQNDNTGTAADQIVKKGAIKKIIDICHSSPEYLTNDNCMQSVTELMDALAQIENLRPKLREFGAVDLVMSAMNMNAGNEELENCGQRVLQKLVGGDAQALEQTLLDYDRLLNNVKKYPQGNVAAMQRLNRAQVNLKNLMMIKGVVDPVGAEKIMTRAIDTYNVVDKIPKKVGPIKEQVLDLALDTIGKTTLIEGAMHTVDLDKALGLLGNAMQSSSPELQIQALNALGVMLAEDQRVVESGIKMGLIQSLQEVLNNSTSPEVTDAAQKALENIREQVIKNPALILNAPNNKEALAAVLQGFSNPQDLEAFLNRLAESPQGANELMLLALDNVGNPKGPLSSDLKKALLKALGNVPTGTLAISPDALKQMLNLLGNPEVSNEEKAAILKIIGETNITPDLAKIVIDSNGIENLLQMLTTNNDPNVLLGALNALGQFGKNPLLAQKILDLNGEQQIVELMKQHKGNKAIQQQGFEVLANIKDTSGGPEKFVLSPDALMYLEQALMQIDPGNRGRADKLVEDLSNLYNGEVEPMVLSRFDNMLEVLNAARDWRVLIDEKTGKPYYYNKQTKETTWTKPQALIAAENALKHLEELAKKSPAEIDQDKLRAAIGHFQAQTNEPLRLQALANALAALAANENNRDAMVRHGLLDVLVKALNGDQIGRDFILAAIKLLNHFAKHPVYKETVCRIGGIRALLKIMLKWKQDAEIIEKAEQCLANLAFQSKLCTAEIMTNNGHKVVANVTHIHKKSVSVNLNAMTLISNLMFKSEENKQQIGDVLRDRIVHVLKKMYKKPEVLRQAARALGNIAFIDDHIRHVVRNRAVQCLVEAMNYHKNDPKLIKLIIDVIGNFANIDEEEYAQAIKQGSMVSVISTIHFEGGAKKIIDVFGESQDLDVIASCINSLNALLQDGEVRRKLIGMEVVDLLFSALRKYEHDEKITQFCIESIELLSESPEGVESIFENNGVSILLQQFDDHHLARGDFVQKVVKTLVNMSSLREPHKDLSMRVVNGFYQQGGIDTVLNAMEANLNDEDFVQKVFRMLTLLIALQNEVSEDVAQKGMRIILRVVTAHENTPQVLISAYQLIGLLAFEEKNLKVIVQYGGINLIVKSILKFPDKGELVKRSIKTLDNIAMASQEHSNIVKQARGKDVIEELIKTYETIPGPKAKAVVKDCKAALLSLNKIETRMKKINFAFTKDVVADPLEQHRQLLKTGATVLLWTKGSSKAVHLLVNPKTFQIFWKTPGGKKTVGKVDIKNVTGVQKGIFPGHGKKSQRDNCFAIQSTLGKTGKSFCFECKNEAERNSWQDGLDSLKAIYRSKNQEYLYL